MYLFILKNQFQSLNSLSGKRKSNFRRPLGKGSKLKCVLQVEGDPSFENRMIVPSPKVSDTVVEPYQRFEIFSNYKTKIPNILKI